MGPTRRVKTIAKKMGLRIGAPRRMPTSTTTVAASTSNTRKKEARRSVVVMASAKALPSPAVLSPVGDAGGGDVAGAAPVYPPRRLPHDASHEGLVRLGEELYPRVRVPLAAQEQEEGERQDARERGEEPGHTNGYGPGG